jgi:branched-chain amino acid transport system permease protein
MNKLLWVFLVFVGILAPYFIYPVFMMQIWCFALFACAFNLLMGYGGLLSFGHAAFFGGAAYITGFAAVYVGLPPLLAILCGAIFSMAIGGAFGVLAIRQQGIYFAMITLALAQLLFFVVAQIPLTGGENGFQGIPRGEIFGLFDLRRPLSMYYTTFLIFLTGFGFIARVVNSPFGRLLNAARENEQRVISLGYDVDRLKLIAFAISATVSGIAGSTKAIVFQFAALGDVHWQTSGDVVLMTLVGGMRTLFGPVAGAAFIITIQNDLSSLGSWVLVVIGLIFVVVVSVFRRGFIGELDRLIQSSRHTIL